MKYVLLIVVALAVSGCWQTHGITCPELTSYTKEQQQQAARELTENAIPVTSQMIADYLKTRDAIRVCQSWQESYR